MSVRVYNESELVSQLAAAFPDLPRETILQTLRENKHDLPSTAEALLTTPSPKSPSTVSTTSSPTKNPPPTSPNKSTSWTCARCTLECPNSATRCLACDGPAPPSVTAATSPSKEVNMTPDWWSTFWATYGSQCGYSQDQAKHLLFKVNGVKSSPILTVETKNKVLRLLGVEEAHPIDTSCPDDSSNPGGYTRRPHPRTGCRR